MYIYIDESGAFAIPKRNPGPAVSCAGALVLPESCHDEIVAEFCALSAEWPKLNGEIKGRLLGEVEISAALAMLSRYGATFECVAIDLGLHRALEVQGHRESNARNVLKNVTPEHNPGLVAELRKLAASMRALSLPEYVHMVVLTQLVHHLLRTKILYYAQTAPSEIGSFRWVIDAKDKVRTRSERTWHTVVSPWLQSQSFREPQIYLVGADYSAHARFMHEEDEPPAHLAPLVKNWKPGEKFTYSDVALMMREHCAFANSAESTGLQLADVVISAARRAMNGNLTEAGWRGLGQLLLKPIGEGEVIHLIQLAPGAPRHWRPAPPYNRTLRRLKTLALSPLVGDVTPRPAA
jgi:hypothetical protein